MSETQSTHRGAPADSAVSSGVLSEHMRQKYLSAMGVQVWYDPVLPVESALENTLLENIPPENSQLIEPRVSDVVTENNLSESADVARSAQLSPQSQQSLPGQPLPEQPLSEQPLSEQPGVVELEQKSVTEPVSEPVSESVPENAPESVPENEARPSVNSLSELAVRIDQCQLCELHASRKQTVCGEGNANASLMIITDAPAGDILYSSESKAMLQQMLQAIHLELSDVYLTSLVKCPTPGQRVPQTTEMICCDDHLSLQIKLIQPKVILVLGELASQQLLVSQKSLADLRLRQYQYQGVPVYASFHAQALFDCSATKRKVWQDLLQLRKIMNT